MIRAVTIETPTLDRLSTTDPLTDESIAYATPSATPPEDDKITKATSKSVQFTMSSAAEYELDCPPKELTPMPPQVARERFPVTETQRPEKEAATEETKHNTATLAEWEADFDSFLCSDEESEELECMLFSRKKGRRSSGFFSPPLTLLLPEDQQGECDAEVNTSMASLAVRSPCFSRSPQDSDDAIFTANTLLDYPSTPSSMHISPPSDVRLDTVNSTGGALVEQPHNESSPPLDASRQLHGALERCADDENVSQFVRV